MFLRQPGQDVRLSAVSVSCVTDRRVALLQLHVQTQAKFTLPSENQTEGAYRFEGEMDNIEC